MKKKFQLQAEDIKDIARGHGACFASDHITIEGQKVGFMYREEPDSAIDSGWRFLSGNENQEYLDTPENLAMYDVNTIANYDLNIIPYLSAPVGSAFIWSGDRFIAED